MMRHVLCGTLLAFAGCQNGGDAPGDATAPPAPSFDSDSSPDGLAMFPPREKHALALGVVQSSRASVEPGGLFLADTAVDMVRIRLEAIPWNRMEGSAHRKLAPGDVVRTMTRPDSDDPLAPRLGEVVAGRRYWFLLKQAVHDPGLVALLPVDDEQLRADLAVAARHVDAVPPSRLESNRPMRPLMLGIVVDQEWTSEPDKRMHERLQVRPIKCDWRASDGDGTRLPDAATYEVVGASVDRQATDERRDGKRIHGVYWFVIEERPGAPLQMIDSAPVESERESRATAASPPRGW